MSRGAALTGEQHRGGQDRAHLFVTLPEEAVPDADGAVLDEVGAGAG